MSITFEHRLGMIVHRFMDRIGDRVSTDNGDRICDEMEPELDACCSLYAPYRFACTAWYCGKCRTKNPPGKADCHCWDNCDWNKI